MSRKVEEKIIKRIEELRGEEREISRIEAARALGWFEEQAAVAVPTLLDAMKEDESDIVRAEAVRALGRIGEQAAMAVPALYYIH